MQRHMKRYCLTSTTNRTWDCKKCNKRFASMHYLKIHVCIDSKKLPHQNIKKKKKIGYHNRLSNTNTGKKPYQCVYIVTRFLTCCTIWPCTTVLTQVKSHISVHNVIRRLSSQVIWPSTSVLTQVKSHISVHNVTRRLTNWVIWPRTSVLTQVKSRISVHNVTRRLTSWGI